MSESVADQSLSHGDGNVDARRALIVGEATDAEAVGEKLADGYDALHAPPSEAVRAAAEFKPSLALFAFGARADEGALVASARRLRFTPETFALPLVFLFRTDERTLRSAALNTGADDYFALDTPRAEMCARLDALYWRAEAGRRAAPVVADQLSEIDNFLLLLDAAGRDAERGDSSGTLALVGLAGEASSASEREQERALAAAHGFLKLNLRRVDAVAFYGPTLVLVYLPRTDSATAQATLARLRAEFIEMRTGLDLAAGLASFPTDDDKIEALVEKAEVALGDAGADGSQARVVAYSARDGFMSEALRHAPARGERKSDAREADLLKDNAREMPPHAASMPDTQERERPARTAGTTRRLLLVVSDAAHMAQINLLMRSAGYVVRAAFDGQQALNLLRIERPDLVLIDFALNDMNGLEMVKRFSKQSGGKLRPAVVLMLPAGREDLRGEATEAGARAVVDLPYDPVELLEVVRASGND